MSERILWAAQELLAHAKTSIAVQNNEPGIQQEDVETKELSERRDFLRSLGKWSTAAIATILVTESSRTGIRRTM